MQGRLDEIDRGILYALQVDANQTLSAIANSLGVATNTVRNRITRLNEEGIIARFTIDIDYSQADVQHHYLFLCTAPVNAREEIANEASQRPGVVRVTTVMTGVQNVIVEAVAPSKQQLAEIAYGLDGLGLTVEREHLIWADRRQPYSGFHLPEE